MRRLNLRFFKLFPDKFYKNVVICLDPYTGQIQSPSPVFPHSPEDYGETRNEVVRKRMWRIGRETEGNRLNADIILTGNKYISRAQATIRYDDADRSWHIHDGFLLKDDDTIRWAYSAHGIHVNGHRLSVGEWEPITEPGTRINLGGFEDAKILVLSNINDDVLAEDWTWNMESTHIPDLETVDESLIIEIPPDHNLQNSPWFSRAILETAYWIQSPRTFWGSIYRLLIIGAITAICLILIN